MDLTSDYSFAVGYCQQSGNHSKGLSRDDSYDEFYPWTSGESITLARYPRDGDFAGNLENFALKTDFTYSTSVHDGLWSVMSL